MKLVYKLFFIGVMSIMSSSCQTQVTPAIVPAVEIKQPPKHPLGIIGAVEPIYFLPVKSAFMARIDTGAENSSIDVAHKRIFERDGNKWVAFDMINRETGEKHHFEKEIEKHTTIKRINDSEKRVVVLMDVKFGDKVISERFSLADRTKFEYQILIGRNILNGRAIVDTSVSNTLN